ncbi:MAG TPA: carboxypeptidase regulatory-like domain-containing protein [Blastocatellia bacterium]|nr:carboxypeptidase regulatory-like domain-containing protein [Blastocatellia bacterium]
MKCWLTAAVLILCFAGTIASQTAASSFTVSGIVQDQNNAAIIGAQVDLLNNNVRIKSTTTDGNGGFRFAQVPSGVLAVRIQSNGFATQIIDVKVGPQSPAPLRISMAIATLTQETTINATISETQISTETSDNQNAVSMKSSELKDLPVFDQDYVGTLSRFLDPGGTGTSGISLVVDGVEANSVGVSASAIKEVKINNDPYSAEFFRPGRGRIEVTTKPGEPEFHGGFNFTFRDAHLNARDPFALVRPPEQRRIYEGIFTGPVRGNAKTTFLISIDRNEEDLQAVVNAIGPNGPIQENIATPARNLLVAGVITHFFSDNNSFNLRYSYQDRSQRNQGIGGITLPEAGYNTSERESDLVYTQTTIISPKLVNQFRVLLGKEMQPFDSLNPGPRIVVTDAFIGGGAQNDSLRREHHIQLTEVVSYSSGRHVIKMGLNVPDWSNRGFENNQNKAGTFFFSSITNFQAGKPATFRQQQGNGHVNFLEKVIGGFVQDDFRYRPNLMVSFGMRYDWQNYFHDNNNFAPRLSFAYSPGKSQKTVIRGGAGIFYDRTGPRPVIDLLLFNGQNLDLFLISNPLFPDPFAGGAIGALPPGIVRLAPDVHLPYTIQYSISLERQLTKDSTLSVNYVDQRGIDLFRSRDINQVVVPNTTNRPDPNFGQIRQIESAGHSRSDALEISFRGRITERFTGMMQYRLSKSYDNTTGINFFPANSYDPMDEWALSNFDRRHRFEMLGTFDAWKLFKLGISVSLYSGSPYSLTTGTDDFGNSLFNIRPAGVPRNSLQGPGYADVDLRWSKEFVLDQKKKDKSPVVTLGLDAFNVFNRVNFVSFVGTETSPFFGQAVAAQPPRRLQLMARFRF